MLHNLYFPQICNFIFVFVQVHFCVTHMQKLKYPLLWDKGKVRLHSFSLLMYFTLAAHILYILKLLGVFITGVSWNRICVLCRQWILVFVISDAFVCSIGHG
jgi:hypothetical protein